MSQQYLLFGAVGGDFNNKAAVGIDLMTEPDGAEGKPKRRAQMFVTLDDLRHIVAILEQDAAARE